MAEELPTSDEALARVAELEAELAQALNRERATREVLSVIGGGNADPQSVFDEVAKRAAALFESHDAITVLLRQGDVLRVATHRGPAEPPPGFELAVNTDWVAGKAAKEKATIHIPDFLEVMDEYPAGAETAREAGYRTIVAVPLLRQGEAVGVITVRRTEFRPFTDAEISLFETFAQQAVIAIENARLFNEQQQALDRQTAMAEVLSIVADSATDAQPVLEAVVERAVNLCTAHDVVLHLVDGEFTVVAALHRAEGPGTDHELGRRDRNEPGRFTFEAVSQRRMVRFDGSMAEFLTRYPSSSRGQAASGTVTALAVPLLREGRVARAIGVTRKDAAPFDDGEAALVQAFADQALIAIENARLFNEQQEALDRQTAMAEVLRIVSESPTKPEAVFQGIAERVVALCDADDAVAFLQKDGLTYRIADAGDSLTVPSSFPDMRQGEVLGTDSLPGEALATGETVHIHGQPEEYASRFPRTAARAKESGMRAILAVPLVSGGETLGVILARRVAQTPFTPEQISLVEAFADQAVIAVQNTNLFNELEERNREVTEALEQQSAMSRVLEIISQSPASAEPVFQAISESAHAICNADQVGVRLIVGDTTTSVAGFPHAAMAPDFDLSASVPSSAAIRERRTFRVVGTADELDAEFADYAAAMRAGQTRGPEVRALLAIPLLRDDEPLGAFVITRIGTGKPFSDREISLMEAFARQAVIAIENARLIRELEESNREVTEALDQQTAMSEVLEIISRSTHDELLLDTDLQPRQQEFAGVIRTSGESLLGVINDILDFSKIEAGALELEQQPFDLRECVESAFDLVAEPSARKALDLAFLIDDDVPPAINGDITRLRQVLVNLLSNAVKFTERGEVVLSVESEEADGATEVRFAVRDTGIGIPQDRMDRLFQVFSQVDSSTTRRYGGTGLGLAVSRRLAELMGGRMWVESTQGDGSTFHFTIRTTPADSLPVRPRPTASPHFAGKRLLVVDDNATNRRILELQAAAWGMSATATESPVEALSWIQAGQTFDAAILDMHMPDMDGVELARAIKSTEAGTALPLMLLSSLASGESEADLFIATLTKPVKQSSLFDALVTLLGDDDPQSGTITARSRRGDPGMGLRHPLRILLAEDNSINQQLAILVLESMGYRADVASNGLEAVHQATEHPYDVVLMDVQMPEMDGLDATRELIRRASGGPRPQIVAMTANAMQGDREECLAAGMDDYLSKPIRVEELAAALERVPRGGTAAGTAQSAGPVEIAAGTPTTADLDAAAVERLRAMIPAGQPRVLAQLVDAFLANAGELFDEMDAAFDSGDGATLTRAAHTLKSSAANFGAKALEERSRILEASARGGSLDGAADMIAGLREAFEAAAPAIEALKGD